MERKKRTYTESVEKLRNVGLKPTRQRIALANILFSKGFRHIKAEDLYNEAISENIKVSLATIYNCLHQFTEAGLLREIKIDSTCSYFDTNLEPHHHYYFEKSKRVEDIIIDYKTSTITLPEPPQGGKIRTIDIVARVDA